MRIVLKLSGESLSGVGAKDFDRKSIDYIAEEISSAVKGKGGTELAIMMGAGNLIRGRELTKNLGTTPVISDQAGMLSTLINAILLQDFLEHKHNIPTRVSSAIGVRAFAGPYYRRHAMTHLERGRVVILAGGTGDPRFTTDTAAVLRAIELEADLVVKGTKVDGIYDKDPNGSGEATLFKKVSHQDFVEKGLRVLDLTAVTLAAENNIDIKVFNLFEKGNLDKILAGKDIGSLITFKQ